MKALILAGIAAIAFATADWQVGQAQGQVAAFRIIVEPSANGLKATCLNGCAWKELTFGCELPLKQPCKAEIDQVGVTGVR